MRSAFNLLVFPNSMFTTMLFSNERTMCSQEKYKLKIIIIIIIIITVCRSIEKRHGV